MRAALSQRVALVLLTRLAEGLRQSLIFGHRKESNFNLLLADDIGHPRTTPGLLGEDCRWQFYPAPGAARASRSRFPSDYVPSQSRSQIGLIGYFLSNRGIFFFVVAFTIPTLWTLARIRSRDIDFNVARGSDDGGQEVGVSHITALLKDRPLLIFLVCAVLFHFANAAMLPLLGEMLSKGHGWSSMMFMSACVVTTQVVVTLLASWSSIKARQWGRKPLLLIAFGVLPVRGLLYTLTNSAPSLVAIQVLDGIAAAIFGVVSVLVIADLTNGTDRFNLTLGAVTTAVGIGAALSQSIAGGIVHRWGYHAGFIFLAAVAALALVILWTAMPETRDLKGRGES